jgi:riboflavin kinase/FMN adenylyltransferase
MRIIRQYLGAPDDATGTVVALGNFDGVHRGHQAVIGDATRLAAAMGVKSAVMCFDPHPRRFFGPDEPVFELTPGAKKSRHIEALGVDLLYLVTFDKAFASLSAEQFLTDVLVGGFKVKHVVAGYDFVFGQGRRGNAAQLQEAGARHGFGVTVVPAVSQNGGDPFSSTMIRKHLSTGQVHQAAELIGRDWEVEGEVLTGEQRGRQIGFPTANVNPGKYVMPSLGVYAVWVGIVDEERTVWHMGVANVGRRPTFNGDGVTVEAHIFDFDDDIYGRNVRIAFVDHIRPEQKFDGIEAIRAQIETDCVKARALLEAAGTDGPRPPRIAVSTAG